MIYLTRVVSGALFCSVFFLLRVVSWTLLFLEFYLLRVVSRALFCSVFYLLRVVSHALYVLSSISEHRETDDRRLQMNWWSVLLESL